VLVKKVIETTSGDYTHQLIYIWWCEGSPTLFPLVQSMGNRGKLGKRGKIGEIFPLDQLKKSRQPLSVWSYGAAAIRWWNHHTDKEVHPYSLLSWSRYVFHFITAILLSTQSL